jgi:hypothetical protein
LSANDLGAAYRQSGRTKPLADERRVPPAPGPQHRSPQTGYAWPNAGLPNLNRIKQAAWGCLNGTAQSTFKDRQDVFSPPLTFT